MVCECDVPFGPQTANPLVAINLISGKQLEFDTHGNCQEIEIKSERATKQLNRLTPILTTKNLHVCTRLKIYKVVITTILIDESEGWWLTSKAR